MRETSGLEFEIAQEHAEALGLAGKRLQESIDRFNAAHQDSGVTASGDLVREIASRAWALMVQRELIGFKHENLRWLLEHFDIPEAALSILGRRENVSRSS